jgi:hypothetical protein
MMLREMKTCSVQQCARVATSIAALLIAMLTAPLYHAHEQDDDGHHIAVVHAHFLESHESDPHAATEIEDAHSHHDARSIDFFTFHQGPQGVDLATEPGGPTGLPAPDESSEAVRTATPQAHGPPGLPRSAPRSPPAH